MSKHYACFEAIVVFFINIGVFKACVQVFWFFHQMIALQMIDLSSYWNYNKNVPHHLSKGEFVALQNLCKNKNVKQKSDEDNSDVIVNKDYLDKMTQNDKQTFGKIILKNDVVLSFDFNQEKHVDIIFNEDIISNCLPFWPILSAIIQQVYIKDSFAYAEDIVEQDSEFLWDVDTLFTNIPLEETIDICANTLFENSK